MPTSPPHIPVLLNEVLNGLALDESKTVIDGTFGAGGYSREMLKTGARVIAIDRDPNVISFADEIKEEWGDKFTFILGNFSELNILVNEKVDAIILDIGVSSMQLDEASRGFSFMRDGPLDMRMSETGKTAADIVNNYDEKSLSDILFAYGEEKRAKRIAQAIIKKRKEKFFSTTLELAKLIEETVGKGGSKNHPATKSFQALRIAVNEEFDELVKALFGAEQKLSEGGLLAIVSFHSLEDRIVKRFFASNQNAVSRHIPQSNVHQLASWQNIGKAQKAGEKELTENPRARSATLRIAKRTGVKARELSFSNLGVPLSKAGVTRGRGHKK